ncbi:MAG: DUF5110 domain-containing protein [Acidovorax sp.]|nr:DUF5110 domain-containing protein [Acidovorax sp.]
MTYRLTRRHPVLFLLMVWCVCCIASRSWAAVSTAQPKANPEAMVTLGNARFTLLTSQLVRMEYSDTQTFEERASLTFINRRLPTPRFTQVRQGKQLRLQTAHFELTYTDDGQRFHAGNLQVRLLSGPGNTLWTPASQDPHNLKGTLRTLDQAKGWNFAEKLEQGLISRSGWALVDDSQNNLFDGAKDWNWVTPRTADGQPNRAIDWYLFAHGNHFKQALYDFTQVAGKIPLPPKYAFGYWWSRYWIYNDREMRELVKNLRDFHIPLDVLIIDMDWHETYGFTGKNLVKDPQGEWRGWTGYTWNKQLFPEPEKFIAWTNQQHLKTALNLHPASGVPTMEEKYAEFAKAYGFDKPGEYIPFNMSEKKWAQTYFKTLLQPMQDWGVDFWWLDWQQFLQDKKIPSLSNTWWLNYTFFTNLESTGKRPMIFHRWGGLGNHRYPIGFSGDAHTTWETLDFEPWFTATAANVGYSYWSHDIGGHVSNDKPTDGEMYLRWIQFGALSPILRTHASKISLIERRPWMFPQHFSAMRDAIQLRYSLAPYIYAEARKTYDSGLAFVHPLYYDYPEQELAYSYKSQYAFGEQMIAAPITTPVAAKTQLAEKKVWLPQGDWFELSSGSLLTGDAELLRRYALHEIPLFVKAGSIIPSNPQVQNLQQRPEQQILTVVPGGPGGSTQLYEDDESSNAYQNGKFTTRAVSSQQLGGQRLKIHIAATVGSYQGMPNSQRFTLKLLNRELPSSVQVNGIKQQLVTEFLPQEMATLVHLPPLARHASASITLEFEHSLSQQDRLFDGNKGFLQRVHMATEQLKFASALSDWGGTLPNAVYEAGNVTNLLQYHPHNAARYMVQLNAQKKSLRSTLQSLPYVKPEITMPLADFLELESP